MNILMLNLIIIFNVILVLELTGPNVFYLFIFTMKYLLLLTYITYFNYTYIHLLIT